MYQNNELYEFFIEKSWEITKTWYKNLDNTDGVYGSRHEAVIDNLKKQNHAFHTRFFSIFNASRESLRRDIDAWVKETAHDEYHQNTPIHSIIGEFMNNQEIYLNLLETFVEENPEIMTMKEQRYWFRTITMMMNEVVIWFTKEYDSQAERRNQAQQLTIAELSSPVIMLTDNTALLPVIGDIDTYRAKVMFEHTLSECAEKKVSNLFMDLSGVPIIDTMVAQQIFQLIEGLKLLGVNTTLSGLRPEIAQTAVQLGIQFEEVTIKSSLSQVIRERGVLNQ